MVTVFLGARYCKYDGQEGSNKDGRVQYFRANQPDGLPMRKPNGDVFGGDIDGDVIEGLMASLDDEVKLNKCRTLAYRFYIVMNCREECVIIITGCVPSFDEFQLPAILAPGVRCLFTVVENELITQRPSLSSQKYLLAKCNRYLVYSVLQTFSGISKYINHSKTKYAKYEYLQLVYRLCFQEGFGLDIVRNPRSSANNDGGFSISGDGSVSIVSDSATTFVAKDDYPRYFNRVVSEPECMTNVAPFWFNFHAERPVMSSRVGHHTLFDALLSGLQLYNLIPADLLLDNWYEYIGTHRYFLEETLDRNCVDTEGATIVSLKARVVCAKKIMCRQLCLDEKWKYQVAGFCIRYMFNFELYRVDLTNVDINTIHINSVDRYLYESDLSMICRNVDEFYYGPDFSHTIRVLEMTNYGEEKASRYILMLRSPEGIVQTRTYQFSAS
jgi:hypothetical protein